MSGAVSASPRHPTQPPDPRRNRGVIFVVFTTILIDFVGFSILIPVLPLFADRLGANALQVGLILTLYALAQLLFLPAWGWFSDRFGRRPVILFSLTGTIFAVGLLAFADSLAIIYVSRILGGFFAASVGTAQAVITDVTPPSERAKGMGQIGAAIGVAFVIGPAMGGLLSAVDHRLPFYAVAAVAAANLVVAWVKLPETRQLSGEPPDWTAFRQSLVPTPIRLVAAVHDRRIGLYLYLFFHIFTAFACLEGVFPLFLAREFGASERDTGLVFAWIGVFVIFTQGYLVGQLTQRFRETTLAIAGLVLCGAGLLSIAWVPTFGWYYAVGPIVALGNGIAFPTFTSLFSQACEAKEAGELLGQSQSMATTGRVIGPLGAGYVMDSFAPGAAFAIAGGLLLLAPVIMALSTPILLEKQ